MSAREPLTLLHLQRRAVSQAARERVQRRIAFLHRRVPNLETIRAWWPDTADDIGSLPVCDLLITAYEDGEAIEDQREAGAVTARMLAEQSSMPVWWVTRGPDPLRSVVQTGAMPIMSTLLSAVGHRSDDAFGPLDEHVCATAERLADLTRSDHHLLHAFDGGSLLEPPARHRIDTEHERAARAFASRLAVPEHQCHVRRGPVDEQVETMARLLRADVVVIGLAKDSFWHRWVDVTPTESIVASSPCDVVVVGPHAQNCRSAALPPTDTANAEAPLLPAASNARELPLLVKRAMLRRWAEHFA